MRQDGNKWRREAQQEAETGTDKRRAKMTNLEKEPESHRHRERGQQKN